MVASRTVTVGRVGLRHAAYVVGGVAVVWRRWWSNRTRADRMARTAEAAGNGELVKYWHEQARADRESRLKSYTVLTELPLRAARGVFVAAVVWFLLLLVLGVVMVVAGGSNPFAPVLAFARFVAWCWWAATAGWAGAVLFAVTVTVAAFWRVGRQAEAAPAWLAATPAIPVRDDTVTPSRVVLAFRELGIAPLRNAIRDMEDGGANMLSPIAIAGCGVEVDVTLPPVGVTTLDVLNRRRKLAENLDRHEHEVHLSVAPSPPRTVRVWAADTGALDEPVGPSPLVYDETLRGDYRRGRAPWGVDLRGDPVGISLYQRHVLMVGLSNQGKTASLRALALWLALDKAVEFRVADLKGAGDWAMFSGIATVLIEGPTDEDVMAATEMLEDGVTEMARRLRDGGPFSPLVLVVDEAQVAYMCPAKDETGRPYGGSKNTSRFLTAVRKLQNQGRAVDVTLWQGTQNPTNQNLPVLAREGAHLRVSTAVGTEEQSRMALGDKAVDGGAAPHLLRAGLDKGMVVVAGDGAPLADGQASATVRTHFIDGPDAEIIARRAVKLRGPVTPFEIESPRDLLQDVHEVLGEDDKQRARIVADRLRETGYRCYRDINGQRLVERFAEVGVIVEPGQGRHYWVLASKVLRALDERAGVYQ